MIAVQTGAGLAGHADFGDLFRDWLVGRGTFPGATAELTRFFELTPPPGGPGVLWADPDWRQHWLAELLPDLADESDRARAAENVAALASGAADAVITGQQPGFLAGPLYTLYKIATTVVLAELRTAAGRPTVPVFWSGEDDDDLREAVQPAAWDAQRHVLVHHRARSQRGLPADRMVGALAAAEYAAGEAALLSEHAHRSGLARDLAAIAADAIASGRTWGQYARRALLRVFRGTGLLVIQGNDGGLHGVADPFYRQLWERRQDLRDAVRQGGRRLTEAGYATAISEPSIQRFLHLGSDGRRRPLPADLAGSMPDAASLRPGVLARSLVQDWLVRPAGVVVGPGEAAYLHQLVPAYTTLGLHRAPLLPRLFAQLGPEGYGAFRAWALELADREDEAPHSDLADVAAATAAVAAGPLRNALTTESGVAPGRAAEVSSQVIRRWTRHLQAVLERERLRQRETPVTGAPPWLRPDGRRQERALAALSAATIWGDPFVSALAHACRRFLDAGLDGDWREYLLTVPAP
jgi:hypothetical protein